MTEKEWLASKTIIDLDLWRSAKNRHRKWRLFAAACCQRAVTMVGDVRLQPVVEAAEQFADGLATWDEMKQFRKILTKVAREVGEPFGPKEALGDTIESLDAATGQKPVSSFGAPLKAQFAFSVRSRESKKLGEYERLQNQEEQRQLHLARDIFGNPFRPIDFDPRWQTSTAVGIAQTMYDSRDFGAMPILADALQDAGCEIESILNHCRDAKQVHVRGCWVVDLVLGKS